MSARLSPSELAQLLREEREKRGLGPYRGMDWESAPVEESQVHVCMEPGCETRVQWPKSRCGPCRVIARNRTARQRRKTGLRNECMEEGCTTKVRSSGDRCPPHSRKARRERETARRRMRAEAERARAENDEREAA